MAICVRQSRTADAVGGCALGTMGSGPRVLEATSYAHGGCLPSTFTRSSTRKTAIALSSDDRRQFSFHGETATLRNRNNDDRGGNAQMECPWLPDFTSAPSLYVAGAALQELKHGRRHCCAPAWASACIRPFIDAYVKRCPLVPLSSVFASSCSCREDA